MAHSAAKIPARPPKALPPRLTGKELDERIAAMRKEIETLEARAAAERKGVFNAITVEEFMELTGLSRQTTMLRIRRKELKSFLVRAGKPPVQRKRRMIVPPENWNRET
jgi:hypothetical protein